MIVQVISTKGPEKSEHAVSELLKTIKKSIKADLDIDVLGGSITTGDMYGYCTAVVEVNDEPDKVGDYLSRVFMPCRYEVLKGSMEDHRMHKWQWAECNKPSVALNI